MKATPKQLELTEGKSREELLLATIPHIDTQGPAFKASVEKIEKIELAEAAKAVLSPTEDEGDTFIFITPENCNAFIDGVAARIRDGK